MAIDLNLFLFDNNHTVKEEKTSMYFVSKLMNNGYGDIQGGFWRDEEVDLAVIEKVWSMDTTEC